MEKKLICLVAIKVFYSAVLLYAKHTVVQKPEKPKMNITMHIHDISEQPF
jgi:hypothetical protein